MAIPRLFMIRIVPIGPQSPPPRAARSQSSAMPVVQTVMHAASPCSAFLLWIGPSTETEFLRSTFVTNRVLGDKVPAANGGPDKATPAALAPTDAGRKGQALSYCDSPNIATRRHSSVQAKTHVSCAQAGHSDCKVPQPARQSAAQAGLCESANASYLQAA